ncbi:MAG TPA: protein kinase [Vicinamibacteria bacterium]|nr:protein kinase [Vicinamibacteria bacterium]
MPLAAGTRLGPYEITAPIGKGGMGEVYRARDTKLDRAVAIKVLPEELASDQERVARFEREAKLLASLNHPNIASIYGFESSGLVLELVEGPTLAERIVEGPIPVQEAIAIARQIADALEAGHGAGVVHRDLKPANVKVKEDGTVKVLDYGLAKALEGELTTVADFELSHSPTLTRQATHIGVILGTAAYMSPEQAKGKRVDKRADIWAFGAVLYEMLTGKRAFAGEDVSETLAHVLTKEPEWEALPSEIPGVLRQLLRICLAKDAKQRLRDIGDARLALEGAFETNATPGEPRIPTRKTRALLAAIGVLAIATVVTTWGWFRAARSFPAVARNTYVAATLGINEHNLTALTDRFAVSADGTLLALVDPTRGGLVLRRTSGLEVTPVMGAPPQARSPVFSPDGAWIAFSGVRALMKIPTAGGQPTVLAEGTDYFINLTWGADDRIRYPSLQNDAIRSVSASGGPVETVSFPRAWVSRGVGLPNGRLLVSLMTEGERQIAVREPDGTLRKVLAGWDARLAPTGHLLFSREEGRTWSVLAARFDVNTARVEGEAEVLAQDVPVRYATPAGADAAGNLFYIAGTTRSDRRVVLLDRAGAERELPVPPGTWVSQTLSADGRWLALDRLEGANRTLWTVALDTGALTQVTYLDDTFAPVWAPDSRRLFYTSFPIDADQRSTSLWSVLTDGQGKVEPVAAQWDAYPGAVSSDGRLLYYHAYSSDQARSDILSVPLDGAAPEPTVLLATPASEARPTPSPDGRWLAYETNASGTEETRVAPLSDLAASIQVSTRGGSPIRFSPDSTKFYFTDGDTIASVDVGSRGPVLASRSAIFSVPGDQHGRVSVTSDGNHAVAIRGGLIYSDIVVLQNALSASR